MSEVEGVKTGGAIHHVKHGVKKAHKHWQTKVKPKVKTTASVSYRHSKTAAKHTGRAVKAGSAVAYAYSKKGAKVAHKHAAQRPHEYLTKKYSWYNNWHKDYRHKHVHRGILTVYSVIIGILLFLAYSKVQALSDLTNDWDFTTASNYTIDSGIETNGATARLKAQNYSSDANTSALFHFDETSGTNADDSTANNNDLTGTNTSFSTGNLNNGLTLNGNDAFGSVADSASLSLSQQNTIEGWTKLSSNFSAGSTAQRQGIVDKGDYQLYYDNETGKVTYELADASATQWNQAGGSNIGASWDANGKRSVNSMIKVGSYAYAAIGVDVGDAAVWRWDGSTWTRVGGGYDSINNSWAAQTYEGVYSLATDGTNVYAGLGLTAGDAEVWKFNGTTWSKIGGDAVNSSWAVNTFEQVWALDYFNGTLYAGLGSSANDAEVWSWNGSSWTKIGGDSLNSGWTTNFEAVASLTNDGTNLYAALGISAGDAEVWRWNGSSWTKIGGDTVNSSWADTTYETVRTLRFYDGNLYAGLGDSAGDAEVWRWNGSSWTMIGGDGTASSWANSTYEQVGAFAWDGTNLYAGLGTGNGDGEVWQYNGSAWTKIGGDGTASSWSTNGADLVNTLMSDAGTIYAGTYDAAGSGWVYSYNGSSWTLLGGDYVNSSWGLYGVTSVQVMQNVGDYLYAGLGGTAGTSMIWRYDGSSWSKIGGQGLNNSWAPNTYEQVLSMASFQGDLYVGLGTTANDAEVWKWDGASWSQVGGDSLNSGWAANYEEVDALAADDTYLYAGLGASASDAEVWRFNGTTWSKIGGDSTNSGWAANYERVASLAIYKHQLVAGLGTTAGDGEAWIWNGSSWAKIGGDSVNSGWDNTVEQVESLVPYNDKLYAGVGNTTDDAELWEWNGTAWSKIGGDDVNSSWTSGTYERIKTMAVYNGDLYVGLGSGTGDGEVWQFNNGTWTKIAGNGINGGWANAIEEVESFSAYKGKFYAGTGLTANADGNVWYWGNNAYLQSNTSSFNTSWHHIAATYDGSTMKLYIDGTLDSSRSAGVTMPDGSRPLLIGTTYGGRELGKPRGYFTGQLDEIRISNIARTGFTSKPYVNTRQTITLNDAVRQNGVWHWDGLTSNATLNGGTVTYRLSDDDGATWKYWTGGTWATSSDASQSNDVSTVNSNISTFPVTFSGIKWQAVLLGDGSQQVTLNGVGLTATSDITAPSANASSLTALKAAGGASVAQNAWTNGGAPYFSWAAGADSEAGVKGYCAYLGTDNTADPVSTKGLLGTSPLNTGGHCQFLVGANNLDTALTNYLGTQLSTNNSAYYLSLKALDNAGNISSTPSQFYFRFDNTPPTNPSFITAPSGFVNSKQVNLTWATSGGSSPSDANAGLAGLQYRIGSGGTWYGDSHSGTGDSSDLLANDGSYTTQDPPDYDNLSDGINNVYFRSWDQAGNVTTSYVTAAIKLNTSGAPSEPQNVNVTPSSNTSNAFSFDWDPPATFVGDDSNLTYCYTINVTPTSNNCTFTSAGVTSLGQGPYATQPGENTFYIAAKDESNNINYSSYATATFTANTPSPGIPVNADIVDVSIKATSNWRLALTWEAPDDVGAGIASYKVYRSTDQTNYSFVGSSTSTTYIDAGLSQQTYYYKVKACDSTNNCGADSSVVDMLPTGKFTSPAALVSQPEVSNITTKKARISWSTDRGSDSRIALGTSSGSYSPGEVANSSQVSAHQIDLDNLSAGTTYYFVTKWTDEDGNTGTSQEFSFTTSPAPSLKEVNTSKVGLSSANVQFTSKDATKVTVLFGKSESFGGTISVNTSTSESTYNVALDGLDDGAKYFYKLVSYDNEGNSYDGSIFSFQTPQRPRIANLRFQPVPGEPTSTQKITWDTNVPTNSTVTYGIVGTGGTDVQVSDLVTSHEVIIRGLQDDSEYFVIAQSRDKDGNLSQSDRQQFRTALDTRPPQVNEISVEASIRGTGAEARGQVVVSWKTDEPATSQVAYAEGSGAKVFNSKTAEDGQLTTEHIVIVSDLPTSKVFSIQPISHDKSGNEGAGETQSAIIGRASDSVMTIILNTLRKIFGF